MKAQPVQLSVYIADDHQLVAEGIASILSDFESIEKVTIFSNGEELYRSSLNQKPDLIFLDIEMPRWDGIVTLEKLKQALPSIPCVMLSMLSEKMIVQKCINLGAAGFVNKDCKPSELNDAIQRVFHGEVFYSNEILKSLSGVTKNNQIEQVNGTIQISEREMEVLRLLCDGLSPKEIADKLFLSHRTVETHKNNIMQKMNVNTIGKLISTAIRNRIV